MLSLQQLIVGGGKETFGWFIIFVIFYFCVQSSVLLVRHHQRPHITLSFFKHIFKQILIWGIILAAVAITMQLSITYIFTHVSVEKIAQASVTLMHADIKIFGWYPAAKLYASLSGGFIEVLLVYAYNYLTVILAFLLSIAFISKRIVFRYFFSAMVIAFLISAPLWYFIPAVSPEEAYRRDTLALSTNALYKNSERDMQTNMQHIPMSSFLGSYVNTLDAQWISADNKYYAVSSFPSLHAAWGIVALCLGVYLWWPLAFFLVPWCILNFTATFYTLQHYGVDSIVGTLVGIVSVLLGFVCIKLIDKYIYHVMPLYQKKSAQQDSNLRPFA